MSVDLETKSAIQNIALVGVSSLFSTAASSFQASGRVGSAILSALLNANRFWKITVLTRKGQKKSFEGRVLVEAVDYDSQEELCSVLRGHDALIITLAVTTKPVVQASIIQAAISAGVTYIIPNEWGSDNAHPTIAAIPVNTLKELYREQIEQSGTSFWVGFITSFWYEYGVEGCYF